MSAYVIRRVRPEEAGVVARHRLSMFQDMGEVPPHLAEALRLSSERALTSLLHTGAHVGWFAETQGGEVVAGAPSASIQSGQVEIADGWQPCPAPRTECDLDDA